MEKLMTTELTGIAAELAQRIENRTARLGVVGLGYVGLPLAVEFAKAGFDVTGIDISASKMEQINQGVSYIQDVPTEEVAQLVKSGKLRATTDFSAISELDTVNICVPTPLRKTKDPDMSFIVSACQEIAKYIHPGHAGDSGIHHVPGHDRRVGAAHAGEIGPEGGRGFLPLLLAGARRSGQPASIRRRTFPRWSAASRRRARKWAGCSTRRRSRQVVPVSSHAGGRDGEAAREHVPHDQHRPGERDGADVRPHGHQRVGSDRRGRHQAVRLHAVLSGPGPRRALHSDRPVLSFLEDQAGRHRSALHRTGRLHQRADAALRGRQGAERAERRTASR